MSEPIFTITTVRHALQAGNRAVGYYTTFEEADEIVRENVMDINESGYYFYAVIEELMPGIYMYPRKELWYKWSRDKEAYEACDKPERFQQVVGWSLG
jgi:hypothetical protein